MAVKLLEGEVIVSVDSGQNGNDAFGASKKFGSRFVMCGSQRHQLWAPFTGGLAPMAPARPHTGSTAYIGGLSEGSSNDTLSGRDNFVGCLL